MSLGERLLSWFGRTDDAEREQSDGDSTRLPRADAPQPRSTKQDSLASPPQAVGTDEATQELPIAQGQELLGPCRECDGYWTRELTRGQKPLTCPVCKREGPPSQ